MLSDFTRTLCGIAIALPFALEASPADDARLIAERYFNANWRDRTEARLRSAFVQSYFRPISERGITIASEEKFADLIPDEDISPYIDRLVDISADQYLSSWSNEQLASASSLLRTSQDVTLADVMDEDFEERLVAALAQARSAATLASANEQMIADLEELVLDIKILRESFADPETGAFAQSIALGIGPLFTTMGYANAISEINHEASNPVTLAAIETVGVLRFANPTQRNALLRELSAISASDGIRFVRPPQNVNGPNEQ